MLSGVSSSSMDPKAYVNGRWFKEHDIPAQHTKDRYQMLEWRYTTGKSMETRKWYRKAWDRRTALLIKYPELETKNLTLSVEYHGWCCLDFLLSWVNPAFIPGFAVDHN